MRRTCWLGAVLCLLLCACGGGESPSPTPTPTPEPTPVPAAVEFTLPYFPSASLHPITGESKTNLTLAPLVYQGLFTVDNRFRAQEALAKSWTVSEDGRTWTFVLERATFSDGSPVTAQEAADSLELARTQGRYVERLACVKRAEAVEGSLVVTLVSPRGNLPVLLDVPIVKETEGEGPPLGSGRYALAGAGESLRLELRPGQAEGLPETIRLSAVQGADELIYAFDTREVSLVSADLTGTDMLGYAGGYEVWDYPTTDLVYLGFRTDRGACRDAALRLAISRALDRESVATVLYARHARAASLPVSPASEWYDRTAAAALDYSTEGAAQALEAGGYVLRDGVLYHGRTAVELTLIVNTDNSFRRSTAEYLAEELEKLGLTVRLEKLSWKDYTDRLEKGNFDLYLAETAMTADFDAAALVGSKGALNYGRWSSRETDERLSALAAAGEEGRGEAAQALYAHWAQQVPCAPICFKEHSVLTQWGQVSGLTPTRGDPFAGDGWSIH